MQRCYEVELMKSTCCTFRRYVWILYQYWNVFNYYHRTPLGEKVSMLTHIYTHTKPGGTLKWSYAKSPGWQPTLCAVWCLICWLALAYKKYSHTWHRMSLLRPGVIKQHKPNLLSQDKKLWHLQSFRLLTASVKAFYPVIGKNISILIHKPIYLNLHSVRILSCLMTPIASLSEDSWCHVDHTLFLWLQVRTDIRPWIYLTVNLVIVDGHFNLPHWFAWVCMD